MDDFDAYRRALGQRVQGLRREAGLTQQAMAEALGMDRVSVGYIEQGARTPKLRTLFAMCQVLGVGMEDLFRLAPERDGASKAHGTGGG